jgi:hypothetical protein
VVLMLQVVGTVGGMAFLPWSTRLLGRMRFLSDHRVRTRSLRRVLFRALRVRLLEKAAAVVGVALYSAYHPLMCCALVLICPGRHLAAAVGFYCAAWMNVVVFSSIILSVWGSEKGKNLESALIGLFGVVCSMTGLLMVYGAIFLRMDVRNSGDPSAVTSLADAAYFSTMTWTTVGYGDIVPGSRLARIFVAVEAINGSVVMAFFIAALVSVAKIFDDQTDVVVRRLERRAGRQKGMRG